MPELIKVQLFHDKIKSYKYNMENMKRKKKETKNKNKIIYKKEVFYIP